MKKRIAVLMGLLVALAGSSAPAGVVSLTDGTANWQMVTGPADFSETGLGGDNTTYIFQERSDFTLGSDLAVGIAGDGVNTGNPGGIIAAGTRVESYLIQFNPDSATGFVSQSGMAVEFDSQILGVIGVTGRLASTDGLLGDPNSTYAPIYGYRGTWDSAFNIPDSTTVNGNQLSFSWETNAIYGEQMRVFTLAPPAAVPEPSTLVLLSLGSLFGIGIVWRRRQANLSAMAA